MLAIAALLFTVHIDVVADRSAYDKLDVQYYRVQRDAGLTPPAIFSAGDVYYVLRPRPDYADLDHPSVPAEVRAKTALISAATHKTLRTHHNEIWQADAELNLAGAKYLVLRTDDVKPVDDDAYETEMKKLRDELTARGVRVIGFFSIYGDGRYRYLFLSDQPIAVRKVGRLAKTKDEAATARPDLTF